MKKWAKHEIQIIKDYPIRCIAYACLCTILIVVLHSLFGYSTFYWVIFIPSVATLAAWLKEDETKEEWIRRAFRERKQHR